MATSKLLDLISLRYRRDQYEKQKRRQFHWPEARAPIGKYDPWRSLSLDLGYFHRVKTALLDPPDALDENDEKKEQKTPRLLQKMSKS